MNARKQGKRVGRGSDKENDLHGNSLKFDGRNSKFYRIDMDIYVFKEENPILKTPRLRAHISKKAQTKSLTTRPLRQINYQS